MPLNQDEMQSLIDTVAAKDEYIARLKAALDVANETIRAMVESRGRVERDKKAAKARAAE
jgi:hypothetical protein